MKTFGWLPILTTIVASVVSGCQSSSADSAATDASATGATDGTSDALATSGTDLAGAPDGTAQAGSDAATSASGDTDPDVSAGAPVGSGCSQGDDCASGWCVPSALGVVCAAVCNTTCADGYRCMQAASETTDPVYVCVATTATPPGSDVYDGDTAAGPDGVGADTAGASDGVGSDSVVGSDTTGGTVATGADAVADGGPSLDGAGDSDTSPTDTDGDGIPDDVDNLPCLAIMLTVYNNGVSSASLSVNGSEVVSAGDFPTTAPITRYLNATEGVNNLAVGGQLTGSPGDSLTLLVIDTQGRVYFETVIVRESGPPKEHSYTFTVDVHCD